jgi:hypothetical protein
LAHHRHGVEDVACSRQQAMTGRQELHAVRRSAKKRHPQLVFEAADLTAEGRLRDVQAPSGAADVALFGDCHEVAQLV